MASAFNEAGGIPSNPSSILEQLPPRGDLERTWQYLKIGLNRILVEDLSRSGGVSNRVYMNLYTTVHDFCVQQNVTQLPQRSVVSHDGPRGAQLIGSDLYKNIKQYLEGRMGELTNQSISCSQDDFIKFYTSSWDRYKLGSKYVNHICDYLNRHWIKREKEEGNRDVHDIYTLCLIMWRENYFQPTEEKLIYATLDWIDRQRQGEDVSIGLLKLAIGSLVTIGVDEANPKRVNLSVYNSSFQDPFLARTRQFYERESNEFLATNPVTAYLKHAQLRLSDEQERVGLYLHQNSEKELMVACEKALISDHFDVLHGELPKFLAADNEEDCSRLYHLLVRVEGGLLPVETIFQEWVRNQGVDAIDKLIAETEGGLAALDSKAYVDTLLSIHKKYASFVSHAFDNNAKLVQSFDNGCKDFINTNAVARPAGSKPGSDSRTPELLARYADSLLKKSAKAADENEIEACLAGIMIIFQYVNEKDAFEKYYSRLLSKRLVYNTSASRDAENSMINKLREACGHEYTTKLGRMFQDIQTSEEMQSEFKQSLIASNDTTTGAADFTAVVLAQGFWPLPNPKTTLNLPPELEKIKKRFELFYTSKHQGRNLNWLWAFGKGEVKANFTKSSKVGYTFMVSIHQMVILLAFNNATSYTLQQLSEVIGVPPEAIAGPISILVKGRALLENKETSTYTLNMDFKNKKLRVNFNLPIKSEQKKERDETEQNIEEDRRWFLQATIVRIMKMRKELTHNRLIQETIEQARKRFQPKIPEIKKCIDNLIEKEYLRREGPNLQYVA